MADNPIDEESTVLSPSGCTPNDAPHASVAEAYEVAILSGPSAAQVFPLWKPSTIVGRDPMCDIFLPDPWVSRVHCRFLRGPTSIAVEDLNAANGSLLRGRTLRGTQNVEDKELLFMGKHTLAQVRRQRGEGLRTTLPADFLGALERQHLQASGDSTLLLVLRVDELVSLVAKYNLDIIEKVVERLDEIVRNHVSGRDCVSRCGLDQFAILTDDRALKLAKKILRDIGARRFVVDDLIFSLTVSAAALPIPEATGVSRASSIKLFGSATQAAFLATRAKPGEIVRLDRFQP